jgi:FkbM family methyltransferase
MGIGAQSSLWRRLAFRFSRSIYIRRRVLTDDGTFAAFVSANSGLKVLDPRGVAIDPVHRRFIRNWVAPTSIVWDVGANLGLFAFPAALKARAGRVYCFEPDADLARNLRRSVGLPQNKPLNVSVLDFALSDAEGTASFEVSKYSRAMNRIQGVARWNDKKVIAERIVFVTTKRIDMLAKTLTPPTVLKIDVEGAELKVIEGAAATIKAHRPSILIEVSGPLRRSVGEFFGHLNYVLLDGRASSPLPVRYPAWDTIAIPAEKFWKAEHR